MSHILVLGGLDDTHIQVCDFFTNYCYELQVTQFNNDDEMYVCNPRSAMLTGRGCFGVGLNDGFVYVFGGVTGRDFNHLTGKDRVSVNSEIDSAKRHDSIENDKEGLCNKCEKYDVENDQWYKIADCPYSMRNPAACALSGDTIYLFGGKCL